MKHFFYLPFWKAYFGKTKLGVYVEFVDAGYMTVAYLSTKKVMPNNKGVLVQLVKPNFWSGAINEELCRKKLDKVVEDWKEERNMFNQSIFHEN